MFFVVLLWTPALQKLRWFREKWQEIGFTASVEVTLKRCHPSVTDRFPPLLSSKFKVLTSCWRPDHGVRVTASSSCRRSSPSSPRCPLVFQRRLRSTIGLRVGQEELRCSRRSSSFFTLTASKRTCCGSVWSQRILNRPGEKAGAGEGAV